MTAEDQLQYARDRRSRLERAGLCVTCGKRPPNRGRKRCERCLQNQRDNIRRFAERNRDKGLCGCGREAPRPGYRTCQRCHQDCRDQRAAKRAELPPLDDHEQYRAFVRSVERRNELERERVGRAVRAGLCRQCRKRPIEPGSRSRCRICLDKAAAVKARRSAEKRAAA